MRRIVNSRTAAPLCVAILLALSVLLAAGTIQAAITGHTGPGGFEATDSASSLLYWLDATSGVTADGGNLVSAWADQGFNGNNFAQATAVNQPLLVSGALGGNSLPAVRFDGDTSSGGYNADCLILGTATTPRTVLLVNNTTRHSSLDGIWGYNAGDYGIRRESSSAWQHPGNANTFSFTGELYVNGAETNAVGLNTPHVLAATGSSSYPGTNIGNYFPYVAYGYGRPWQGDIGEVIVYDRTLNTAELAVVGNALSAKYDIAMNANDHYAGDGAAQGNYDLDVIGIGRDDAANVRTSAGAAGLGIETAGSLADGAFVMAGHKTAVNSITASDVPAGAQRWDRVWYVDNAAAAAAQLTFDYGDAGLAAPGGSTQFALAYSPTNAFSFSPVESTPTVTGDQVSFSVAGDELQSGYYTLQQTAPDTGPGGFESTSSAALLYWLKADSGVTADAGDKVSNWADQSAHGRDFSQSSDDNQPLLVDGAMGGNGLPVIRFDADRSGGFNTIDKLVMSESTTPDTIFIVNRLISDGNSYLDGIIGYNNADKGIRRYPAGYWRSASGGSDGNDFAYNNGLMFINGVATNAAGVNVPHILVATRGSGHDNSYGSTALGQYFYSADRAYNGDIAEVIVYDRKLNLAEISVVENYLSAKYDIGIDAAADHYAGDESAQGDYDLDVIGIGRIDSANELTDASAMGLGISAVGGSLGDDEWVMAGHKTPVNSWVTDDVPAPANQRWDRAWYIDVDGLVDTELTFDFSAAGLTPPEPGAPLALLYSPTNAFAFEVLALGPTASGDQFTFALPAALLSDGYYTLAAVPEPSTCALLILAALGLVPFGRRRR